MFFLRAQCVQKKRDAVEASRLVPSGASGQFDMPRSIVCTVLAWIMLIGGILCGIGSTFVVIYNAVTPSPVIPPCTGGSAVPPGFPNATTLAPTASPTNGTMF